MSSDPSRLIAALARDRINLDLKTLDLCFLAGLYLRADRASLASFEEDVLIDMFEQICDVVDPGAERPRKRATHACAWHDAQAAVPGAAWDKMVRRYRTEGRRQQGKGIFGNEVSEGSMRQNPCT